MGPIYVWRMTHGAKGGLAPSSVRPYLLFSTSDLVPPNTHTNPDYSKIDVNVESSEGSGRETNQAEELDALLT